MFFLGNYVLRRRGGELLIRRKALEQLVVEGVRGLVGCRMQLRFRQKSAPGLLEPQVESRGLLHPERLPPDRPLPCVKCGCAGFSLPESSILDTASLPGDRDLFRPANFQTVLIGIECFVDSVRRLGFEELDWREVPVC